jgi:mxaA protein
VEQPRNYGYVVGDLLERRILLEVNGQSVTLKELPRKERIAVWFSRRNSRETQDSAGRRWLAVEYQIINAAKDVGTVMLPAQVINVATSQGELQLTAAEWPITVSPLTPRYVDTQGGIAELQPDLAVPLPDSAPLQRRLRLTLAALCAALLGWLAWSRWRDFLAARHQPFARAQRELRQLDAQSAQAWRCMHRAFDATAGVVLQITTLEKLFDRAPQLIPLRAEIEAFYQASAARFFSDNADSSRHDLRALCTQLRRIERSS